MIRYRDKKAVLEKIRAMMIALIDEKLNDTDKKYSLFGHIKKNEPNYGFKQKYMIKYSKKFYLQQSSLVIKRDYDLITGREALETEVESRNYRTGYNLNALIAFDEILDELVKIKGYEIVINKNTSTDDIELLYNYLKLKSERHQKQS